MTAKKKATKKKTGRPSKFGTVDKDQVAKLAKAGWTDIQMAEFFGVAESTWHLWKKANPEYADQLSDWKLEADSRVERSLFERATGYEHPEEKVFQHGGEVVRAETMKRYPPDTAAMIFWLKNRLKEDWRDRQEIGHSGIQEASDEDIQKALAQKLDLLKGKGVDVNKLLNSAQEGKR